MRTCESCRVSFEPNPEVQELTSLRVLCPQCAAERAAAKQRKSQEQAAKLRAATESSQRLKPPTVTSTAATPSVKREAPTARSAPPASRDGRAAAKNTAAARPARVDAAKTARPAREKPPKNEEHDPEQIARKLKKKGSREMLISFGVAFVVFAVAGVVLWKVLGQKKREAQVAQAYLDSVEEFKTTFMAFDITDETKAKELVAYSEEKKPLWAELEFGSEVVSRVAKAKTFLEGVELRRDLEQRLSAVEDVLARAAELAPSELAEQRRRLDELAAKAEIGGAEFVARVARDRENAEQVYSDRLVSSAEAAAAAETLDRTALATIQLAEDELFKMFEAAYKAWQKNNQDATLVARKDATQERYQGLVKLSDETVQRFFTPEAVAATPWRDLLSEEHKGHWKAPEAKGYEHRIDNGTLRLVGPDPTEKSECIMSMGDREVWRDFEVDMEFTIEKGQFTLYFRLPPAWQENVIYFDLTTDEGSLVAGQPYRHTFRVLGSTFTSEEHSEDSLGPTMDNISWVKPRKGAFGIAVSKETEVKFTKLQARVLR